MEWGKVKQFPTRQKAPRPELPLCVLFLVVGTTQRPLRCALYRIETGWELRLEYEDRLADDVQNPHLFRVRDEDAIATLADQWHMALIATGFTDLDIV